MPRIDFQSLPQHSRIWVFPAGRLLNDEEAGTLLSESDTFLEGWAAHGHPLVSGRALLEGHFLIVGVDEDAEAPSGCSIDALMNRLEILGKGLGVRLVEHAPVWYRDEGGAVRAVDRAHFRTLAQDGVVTPDTRVFDTSIFRLAALRAHGLEQIGRAHV